MNVNSHQKDLIRREAFIHGFVAARDPRNPRDTLLVLEEAERAYAIHVIHADRAAKDREDL